jgi:hypothetical protein
MKVWLVAGVLIMSSASHAAVRCVVLKTGACSCAEDQSYTGAPQKCDIRRDRDGHPYLYVKGLKQTQKRRVR